MKHATRNQMCFLSLCLVHSCQTRNLHTKQAYWSELGNLKYLSHTFISKKNKDETSRREGWDPSNRINCTTFVMPVPRPDLDFQRYVSWYFLCAMNGSERPLFILLALTKLSTMKSQFSFHNQGITWNVMCNFFYNLYLNNKKNPK